jgi:UDP-GlcNAc:undecaprenyl-phosphate GlcNAc-1-phosphate transferase
MSAVLATTHFVVPGKVFYAGGMALVIVLVLTPAVGGLARRIGAVDQPGEGRRLHVIPIPRLGGLGLFFGIFVPVIAFVDLTRPVRGILLGAAIATMVGALDDARGLVWWQKLAGQVGAAVTVVSFGVWVDRFTFPVVGIQSLPSWVGVPATVFWIVAIMNMVNFLDGLDGLAAGVCAIAAGTFATIALSLDKVPPAVLAAIVCGAALGFLRHNFYPARIFMGDSGAMLLGFVLAAISVQGLLKTAATVALAFPLLVLAIPILDTSFVVLKRLKYRRPITGADASHLHHRFMDIGFSQRRAVLTMYVWCATLAAAALATRFIPPRPHGRWQLEPTIEAGLIGLGALLASVYVVYLLEIVKVANPRIKRRERTAEKRRSA